MAVIVGGKFIHWNDGNTCSRQQPQPTCGFNQPKSAVDNSNAGKLSCGVSNYIRIWYIYMCVCVCMYMEYDIAKLWAVALRYSILQLKAFPGKTYRTKLGGPCPIVIGRILDAMNPCKSVICTNQTKFINHINHKLGLVYNSSGSPSTGFYCSRWKKTNPATNSVLNPPDPKSQCFSACYQKWFEYFVHWSYNALQLTVTLNFGVIQGLYLIEKAWICR